MKDATADAKGNKLQAVTQQLEMEMNAFYDFMLPSIEEKLKASNGGLPAQSTQQSLQGKKLYLNGGQGMTIADIYLFMTILNI